MKQPIQKALKAFTIAFVMCCRCLFKGHEPEKHLTETEGYIATTRCKHCHSLLMGGFHWKFKNIPPPNSTPEQVEEWEKYCEDKWRELRQGCA